MHYDKCNEERPPASNEINMFGRKWNSLWNYAHIGEMTKEVEDAFTDSNRSGGKRPRARDNNSCSACPQQKYETATTTITLSTASFLSQMKLSLSPFGSSCKRCPTTFNTTRQRRLQSQRVQPNVTWKMWRICNHAQATNHF